MAGMLYFLLKLPQNSVLTLTRRIHITRNKKVLTAFKSPITISNNRSVTYNTSVINRRVLTLFNVHSRLFRTSIVLYEEKDVVVPEFPESVAEGDVRWNKQVGDSVATDEVVCEIETDKVSIPVPAPGNGVIVARYAEDGGTIKAHSKIFRIKLGAGPPPGAGAPAPKAAPKAAPPAPRPPPKPGAPPPPKPTSAQPPPRPAGAPPLVPSRPSTPPPSAKPSSFVPTIKMPPPDPTKEISGTRSEFRVKMNRMRQRIAVRLKEAQNEAAMLTTFNEIDMSSIIAFRKAHQEAFTKKHGIKLGFMSAFIKASSYALQEIPIVNAFIEGLEIVYRDYIDMSVAVATPKGLVVPVIRNVGDMSFADIEKRIVALGELAKKGRLPIEDMDGGTFTISNGGVFGSLMGTPIINPPQSAILGMHATFERPVAIKGQVVIRPMMYVALTYDHRLIDGREAVLFLRKIKDGVENPTRILAGI